MGNTELVKLLELVRFPLLNLTSLDSNAKEALKYLSENAGVDVRKLIVEAILIQTSKKRLCQESNDSEAYERRKKRRVGSGEIPQLNATELGMVMCGGLW